MSERRVFVSLTEQQVIEVIRDIEWSTGVAPVRRSEAIRLLTEAVDELHEALKNNRRLNGEPHDGSSTDG